MGKVYMSSKVVSNEGLGWPREYNMCVGKNTRNYKQYFLTLVLFTFCTCRILRCFVYIVSCLVCIVVILCLFIVQCVYCCSYFRCRTAG